MVGARASACRLRGDTRDDSAHPRRCAKRLQEAGVVTTLRREPDLVHGFINAAGLGGRSAEALGAIAADLREALSARLNELGPK